MATGNQLPPTGLAASFIAKAAAKPAAAKEPEVVEVTQFISPEGKVYWAKKARTSSCIERHLVKKQVVKGSVEDQ